MDSAGYTYMYMFIYIHIYMFKEENHELERQLGGSSGIGGGEERIEIM